MISGKVIDEVAGVEDSSWVGLEISGTDFADQIRWTRRFQTLMEQLAKGTGKSLSFGVWDWASRRSGQYRKYYLNERVWLEPILAGSLFSPAVLPTEVAQRW